VAGLPPIASVLVVLLEWPLFHNLLIYKLAPGWTPDFAALDAALLAVPFTECGSTQPVAMGFVAPRGLAHGAVVESVAGQLHASLAIEKKLLPGSVVKRRIDEIASRMERETGRRPGKKQQRELKDQVVLELLPRAFTRRAAVRVWIAPEPRLLLIDAASAAVASEVITQLVAALTTGPQHAGFNVLPLHTALSPAVLMRDWLSAGGEPPAVFSIDRECELKSADEMKSVVRYARHPLDTDEVRQHIEAGKTPTRLALTWNGRVSFTLTDTLVLRKIEFQDVVFEGKADGQGGDRSTGSAAENFDADAALATGELLGLISDLIEALGGEADLGAGAGLTPPSAVDAAASSSAAAAVTTAARPEDRPPWE
jgi:recombination associated protein RdgC